MKKTKIIVLFAAVLVLFTILSVSTVSAGDPIDVWVYGKVLDGDGDGIVGADVRATCNGATRTGSTGSNGNYGIDFTGTTCSAGDTVFVEAEYQSHTGSDSGGVEDYINVRIANVDVKIDIPEFATIAIPAVSILGLFLFFNRRKRREE